MTKLPYNADIQLNDVVVTSGTGGVFPAGLLVGTVVKVNTSSDGLSKEAIIEPYCDFDDIQFVLVIRQLSEEEIAAQQKKESGDAAADDTSSDSSDTDSGEDDSE